MPLIFEALGELLNLYFEPRDPNKIVKCSNRSGNETVFHVLGKYPLLRGFRRNLGINYRRKLKHLTV